MSIDKHYKHYCDVLSDVDVGTENVMVPKGKQMINRGRKTSP